jgi:membrane protease YdiL (CAAX protease family)
MKIKAISGYVAVLTLSLLLYAAKPVNALYYSSLPVLMVMFPIIAGYKVKLRFAVKDIILGITVSVIILLPYYFIFSPSPFHHPLEGGGRSNILYYILFQLLSVAFPEEFFFRGFLQDSTGRNLKAVVTISALFAAAHLPRAIFLGEWISLLSFFPSLVMGWLYMKTNNIIPGTIFHLLANLVYKII